MLLQKSLYNPIFTTQLVLLFRKLPLIICINWVTLSRTFNYYFKPLGTFLFAKILKNFDFFNTIFFSVINTTYKYWTQQIKHFTRFFIFYWFKLTFRGKGFRVRKFFKSKKVTFNFGRSHWTKILLNLLFFKILKIRRQNYIWLVLSKFSSVWAQYYIRKIKPISRYTKRGLRLKKQFIKKRFGKISQMISSLHF